jgi:addiction module RelE/StbE family toxin
MRVIFQRSFIKQYDKLPLKIRDKFDERLLLWLDDPEDSRLRVHALHGKHKGYWSFNVTGDVRALYRYEGSEVVIFALIGTHSELYG